VAISGGRYHLWLTHLNFHGGNAMKKILCAVALTALVSAPAFAKSYQPQGCGLGSTIWTDGSNMVHQVLGATTNGSSGNQTFGITSGTSNCELDGSKGKRAQAVFIEANRVALANDIARGQGDTLASLAHLYGCDNVAAAGPALQQNYKAIFPSENASVEQIEGQIANTLESACI
jgi:opacity protein-like surface antigen